MISPNSLISSFFLGFAQAILNKMLLLLELCPLLSLVQSPILCYFLLKSNAPEDYTPEHSFPQVCYEAFLGGMSFRVMPLL